MTWIVLEAVFWLVLLSVAVEVIVWLPDDNLFTAIFTWQDAVLVQVLLVVPSIAMVIFDIPLSSEAVVRIAKLPFVGTINPSAGAVIVITGGTVSSWDGGDVDPGVGDSVGVGVGVAVGFNTRLKFVAVSWNTDWSAATSCI